MSENPYDAPLTIDVQTRVSKEKRPNHRPLGVSILAVLHLLGGALLFVVQFLLFANLGAVEQALDSIGMPPLLLVVGVIFLSLLTLASGVGMWMGRRWGWWLAAFYYVYSVFRNATAIVTIMMVADQFAGARRGVDYYLIKHGGRIIVHALLFLYFFKGNVLEFFDLESLNKPKAIGILVGICLAITAFTSALGWVNSQ